MRGIEIPHVKSSHIKLLLMAFTPITLGFGVYPLLIPAVIVTLLGFFWIGSKSSIVNVKETTVEPGYLIFSSLLGLFFFCYAEFYLPYHPEILVMSWSYFQVLFGLCIFTVLWIIMLEKNADLVGFIWMFCLGSLLFSIATVIFAILLQKPPFYGSVIDIRYLPFGTIKFVNSPGIANLLCLFPTAFLAGFLLKPDQRPRWFWMLGGFGFVLSLISALTLGQRSYFVVVLFITPIIVALFLLLLRSWRAFVVICTLLIGYRLLRWLDLAMGMNFLYRPLDQSLFNDARFQMFHYWLEHLVVDPFKRVEVGPIPWNHLQWFHNFFADIHRLSGFWALLTAVILVAYIIIRLISVIRIDRRLGLFLMAIAIPCFLIMNTSVVPEGERQPFLLLLAIGAISEVILGRHRRSPESSQMDAGKMHDIGNAKY